MIYNEFKGLRLSALGLGTMRLPTKENYNDVDEEETARLVKYAIDNGINYFDTAWGYHGGNSEIAIGKALKNHPRESYYVATKFPGYDVSNMERVEEIFEKQLKKLQVDYFDFYLFHNVCEKNVDMYIDPKYKIHEYLMEQKRRGRIRHLGFSTHGSFATMQKFLDAYGKDMEFCQLQINYLDWKFQSAKEKVEMVTKLGIPVWVMEPVRGGKLATLPEEYSSKLSALRPDATVVEWAFRFIQGIPEVKMTLSGMSNMEQLKENIKTYEKEAPLSDTELKALTEIADDMIRKTSLPCTSCRYCTDHCPMELDIPKIIELYNEHTMSKGGFIAPMVLGTMPEDKRPTACIGCRSCEAVCPQQIKIADMMADFASKTK
ncbi:MAG: aldo/keto reductase [Clostridia bacterium]|nr:aldo/keto reductase [Clostridia bacterium]